MSKNPTLKKGKVTNIREMAVDLAVPVAKEAAKLEPTGMLDTALKIVEHPLIQPLLQQGIQMLMTNLMGIGTPPQIESAGVESMAHSPEKSIRPRSDHHALLFGQLNSLPGEVIAQITPFLTMILKGDVAGAMSAVKEQFGGVLGIE